MFTELYVYGFLTPQIQKPKPSVELPPHANYKTVDFLEVSVFPDWLRSITLSWKYPAWLEISYCNVYRSDSLNGPWTRLNLTPIKENNWFKDTTQHTSSKFNQDFYLVEAVLLTGEVVRSEVATWDVRTQGKVEIMADEIQRREWLLLRKFTGIKTAVFPRKAYGTRCPTCWDKVAKKVVRDHCPDCFGSGFKDGFWNPIKTLLQYEPTPNQLAKTYFGKFEQNDLSAWTICSPQLNPDDILVRLEDMKVYEVVGAANTELRGRRVRQIMHLTELARTDAEYRLVSKILNKDFDEFLKD